MGNGFTFLNNRLHSPGRVLLKAGGRMEGNVLDTPHSLEICPEVLAADAAGIEGLIIHCNTIRHAGWFCAAPWSAAAGALSMTAAAAPPKLRPSGVFANVLIEDNLFEDCSGPNLVVTSARAVTLRRNRFLRPQHDQPPNTGASYQIPTRAVVWIAESQDIEWQNNEIKAPGPSAGEPVQMGLGVENIRGVKE